MLFGTLYIPSGQVFGSNTSAQNFEPITKSRTLLAQHIFEHDDCDLLIEKSSHLIGSVQFADDTHPTSSQFVPVKPCAMRKGIRRNMGHSALNIL